MSSYQELASIYEQFMLDAPYETWYNWLNETFPSLSSMKIADIGCGTGTLTRLLAAVSHTVWGVDPSEEMLGLAAQRALAERVQISWLCQDARDLVLPQSPDLLVSSCDSLNYIVEEADFNRVLKRCAQSLRPGGFMVFDVVGEGRLQQLREGFSYDLRDDAAVLFESYVTDDVVIRYELTAFLESAAGGYRRFDESHEQRFYSPEQVQRSLQQAGFKVVHVLGDFGDTPVDTAQRVVFAAQRV